MNIELGKQKILDIKNISKKYSKQKRPALDKVSFVVSLGEFHGFIGKNGAGKTTLIKIIIGAYSKYSGDVEILGINNKKKKWNKTYPKIGYIPEKAHFPIGYSVFSFLYNIALLNGFEKNEARKIVNKKIKEFKLDDFHNKNPNNLSSGQKKKILLIQALMIKPQIIIMDEPMVNLDPEARHDFFDKLTKLNKQGITIFISSHILTELDKYISSFTLIDEGKILYSGDAKMIDDKENIDWQLDVDDLLLAQKTLTNLKIEFNITNNLIIISTSEEKIKEISKKLSKKIFIKSISQSNLKLENLFQKLLKNKEDKKDEFII